MMAMRNNEHTIVGDLLASAKGIDKLFTQLQSLQAHMGRARTTYRIGLSSPPSDAEGYRIGLRPAASD